MNASAHPPRGRAPSVGTRPRGRPPDGNYEHAGGPSLREVAGLLDRHAVDPLSQLRQPVRVATYTVAIGNADAHGKKPESPAPRARTHRPGPLHDTVPTAMRPTLPGRAAMSINARPHLAEVGLGDIVEEARSWAFDGSVAREAAVEVGETIPRSAARARCSFRAQGVRARPDHSVPPQPMRMTTRYDGCARGGGESACRRGSGATKCRCAGRSGKWPLTCTFLHPGRVAQSVRVRAFRMHPRDSRGTEQS